MIGFSSFWRLVWVKMWWELFFNIKTNKNLRFVERFQTKFLRDFHSALDKCYPSFRHNKRRTKQKSSDKHLTENSKLISIHRCRKTEKKRRFLVRCLIRMILPPDPNGGQLREKRIKNDWSGPEPGYHPVSDLWASPV